jgi:hypothetical protein|tara:strand:- start:365 stop:511 length:147 start_codon:yes stop_codon:yes gene_type:complete
MSRKLNMRPNMVKAINHFAKRNVKPKPVLRKGGRPLAVKKSDGCGCGK